MAARRSSAIMSDEDEDMQDLPPAGPPLVFGTLADAVQRSSVGVAAAVQSGNVQLATTAEHLELSLVRCDTASWPARWWLASAAAQPYRAQR